MHPNASKCSKLVQICPIYYYSYNSGGEEHGHEIYFKTSSNSFKLLQTPPNTFQTLPNPVQMRPNTSKCVETCPNLKMLQTCPNLSKLVQTCPNLSKHDQRHRNRRSKDPGPLELWIYREKFSKWENFHFLYFFIVSILKNILKTLLLLSLYTAKLPKHFTFPHLYPESFPLIGHLCP